MLRYLVCTLGLGVVALSGMALLGAQEPLAPRAKVPGSGPLVVPGGGPAAGKGVHGAPGAGLDRVKFKGVTKDRFDSKKGRTLMVEKLINSGRDKNRISDAGPVPGKIGMVDPWGPSWIQIFSGKTKKLSAPMR